MEVRVVQADHIPKASENVCHDDDDKQQASLFVHSTATTFLQTLPTRANVHSLGKNRSWHVMQYNESVLSVVCLGAGRSPSPHSFEQILSLHTAAGSVGYAPAAASSRA